MKNNKKPFYKRIWFIVVAIIVLIIGITALTMPFTYGVQNIILKTACKVPNDVSVPENYDEIVKNIKVFKDIPYKLDNDSNKLDLLYPNEVDDILPLFVYFHGGYYVGGDKASAIPYCSIVANDNYIVANVNYELAPKQKYPTQLIQANEAIKFLVDNNELMNIDCNKIFIGGDSAGAHLAGMLGAFYTNIDLQNKIDTIPAISKDQLKGVVLNCGYYNTTTLRDTKFPFINDAMWMVTGEKKYEKYNRIDELNTINNVNIDYPNTFLLCGSDDPFYSQNLEMQEKLNKLNIKTTAYLPISKDEKLKHEFQRNFKINEANTAIELLLSFLEENK